MTNKMYRHTKEPRPFTYIGEDGDNHVMKYDGKYVLVSDKVFSEMTPDLDLTFSFELYEDNFSLQDCMNYSTLSEIPIEIRNKLEDYLCSMTIEVSVKSDKVILNKVNDLTLPSNSVLAEIK